MQSGEGKANAITALLAVGLSPNVDLSRSYIIVDGIGGASPPVATVGSVALINWIVDGDLGYDLRAEKMPIRLQLGCDGMTWCDAGPVTGTEAYRADDDLVTRAFRISRATTLDESEAAREYALHYAFSVTHHAPSVLRCGSLSSDAYWFGERYDAFAHWWVRKWSADRAEYCVTDMEDGGYATAVSHLQQSGRALWNHFLIIRSAANFDEGYRGPDTLESFLAGHKFGGAALAAKNGYVVAAHIVNAILKNNL